MSKPANQLYSATYSNVPVYEFLVNGGSVMRRKKDNWVNATHVLKAANFAKAKRTRILEKDVQTGKHEKVQGGYGKYQGTWVPLVDAKNIAQRFSVYDILRELLEYENVEGQPDPPPAPKHQHAKSAQSARDGTPLLAGRSSSMPLKRGKNGFDEPPKKRGRPKRNATVSEVDSSILHSGNFDMMSTFEDRQDLTKNGVPKKKRGRKPKAKPGSLPSLNDSLLSTDALYETPLKGSLADSQIVRSFVEEKSSPLNEQDLNTYFDSGDPRGEHIPSSDIEDSHIRKIFDDTASSPNEFISDSEFANALTSPGKLGGLGIRNKIMDHRSLINNGTNKLNQLNSGIKKSQFNVPGVKGQLDRHKPKWYDENNEFTRKLVNYFMKSEEEMGDSEAVPEFLLNPPSSFDVNDTIDSEGNTALHWACAMGNLVVIEVLLKSGANYRSRNNKQEIPLMRTVRFNNSYTKRTFAKILDLLRDTLLEFDVKNRTLLHHVVLASTSNAKHNSARYYLEILLAKVSEMYDTERLHEYLNLTDRKGNTALFYALTNNSRKCVKVLLSYNARTDIKNVKGNSSENLMVVNYPPTPKLVNNYQNSYKSLSKLILPIGKKRDISGDQSKLNNAERILQVPRYSELIINSSEKAASGLIEKLNDFAELYDEEIQKKQLLIYDLNKYQNELNHEISTIERNIVHSSMYANQLVSSSIAEDEDSQEMKNENAKNIIEENLKKLDSKIQKQNNKLQNRLKGFQFLLNKIQIIRLNKVAEAQQEVRNPFLDEPKNESGSLEMSIELAKLQVKRLEQIERILFYFKSDENSGQKQINLYRRLVAACCNIGIDEVDELIDIILENLQK